METHQITLRLVWRDYIEVRTPAENTIKNGASMLNALKDWNDLDISTITRKMVREKFLSMKKTPAMANGAFRLLSTLYNFAISNYETDDEKPIFTVNPVGTLSRPVSLWYPDNIRQRHIPLKKLATWWSAVLMLQNTTVRDYMLLCVLLGFRHEEASALRWSDVDFEERTITIPETKNGSELVQPFGRFVDEMLLDRKRFSHSPYVFPGDGKKAGHMVAPYRVFQIVEEATGLDFSPHDLRRTFNKIAIAAGIDEFKRKRLMNHSFQDVTGKHYSPPDPEELRESIQKIEDLALRLADMDLFNDCIKAS